MWPCTQVFIGSIKWHVQLLDSPLKLPVVPPTQYCSRAVHLPGCEKSRSCIRSFFQNFHDDIFLLEPQCYPQ